VLALRPQSQAALTLRAEVRRALHQWPQVVADCNALLEGPVATARGLERANARAAVLCRRAEAWVRLGKFHRAVEDCAKAIQLDRDMSQAYAYRGEAFFQLGLHKYAAADFEIYRTLSALAANQNYPPPMRIWRHLWREW